MTKYSRTVQWSEQDDAYLAICPELAGVSAFGDSPEEALAELDVVIEPTIETYEEKGWKLPAPTVATEYSGQFRTGHFDHIDVPPPVGETPPHLLEPVEAAAT